MLQRGGKHLSTTTYTVSAPLGRDQRATRELPPPLMVGGSRCSPSCTAVSLRRSLPWAARSSGASHRSEESEGESTERCRVDDDRSLRRGRRPRESTSEGAGKLVACSKQRTTRQPMNATSFISTAKGWTISRGGSGPVSTFVTRRAGPSPAVSVVSRRRAGSRPPRHPENIEDEPPLSGARSPGGGERGQTQSDRGRRRKCSFICSISSSPTPSRTMSTLD